MSLVKTIKSGVERMLGVRMYKKLPHGFCVMQDLSRAVDAPKTVFDVGANIGQSAIKFSSAWPNSKIYSFEPVEATFSELEKNTSSLSNVERINMGVGENDKERQTINIGTSSLKNSIVASTGNDQQSEITLRSLDGYCEENKISTIDFLKIDTEGYDLHALKGGSKLLSEGRIKSIFVEVGFEPESNRHIGLNQFEEFLAPHQFGLHGIYGQMIRKSTGRLWFANALFLKDKN